MADDRSDGGAKFVDPGAYRFFLKRPSCGRSTSSSRASVAAGNSPRPTIPLMSLPALPKPVRSGSCLPMSRDDSVRVLMSDLQKRIQLANAYREQADSNRST